MKDSWVNFIWVLVFFSLSFSFGLSYIANEQQNDKIKTLTRELKAVQEFIHPVVEDNYDFMTDKELRQLNEQVVERLPVKGYQIWIDKELMATCPSELGARIYQRYLIDDLGLTKYMIPVIEVK